jgi:hypothetical protein
MPSFQRVHSIESSNLKEVSTSNYAVRSTFLPSDPLIGAVTAVHSNMHGALKCNPTNLFNLNPVLHRVSISSECDSKVELNTPASTQRDSKLELYTAPGPLNLLQRPYPYHPSGRRVDIVRASDTQQEVLTLRDTDLLVVQQPKSCTCTHFTPSLIAITPSQAPPLYCCCSGTPLLGVSLPLQQRSHAPKIWPLTSSLTSRHPQHFAQG